MGVIPLGDCFGDIGSVFAAGFGFASFGVGLADSLLLGDVVICFGDIGSVFAVGFGFVSFGVSLPFGSGVSTATVGIGALPLGASFPFGAGLTSFGSGLAVGLVILVSVVGTDPCPPPLANFFVFYVYYKLYLF